MTSAFDDRLVNLVVTVDGQTFTYDQNFAIYASGMHYTNGNLGECALRINNIPKADRDFIIAKTSPWNLQKTPAQVTLNVGRASYGTFQMFQGSMIASSPTQPPDIGLTLHSLSKGDLHGYVTSLSTPTNSTLKQICQQVANAGQLTLDFQATSTNQVTNYHFTGAVGKQIQNLNRLGVNAYVDAGSNTLVVTDPKTPRNTNTVILNSNTGMIGVPEITELGVRCKQLISNEAKIGAPVQLTSTSNPSANGDWFIYQLRFDIATREVPFYWLMELARKGYGIGFSQ